MAKNKIITSEGNVQFQLGDGSGKIINVHPFHIYSVFNEDTVSFILIAMPKSSGLAIFTSKAEDLEVNGTTYTFAELPDALAEAFAVAGAQARAEIVDELPETGQTNTIYLVPKEDGQGFDEYIYIDGQWELLGDTDIELDRYVEKTDFSAYTAATDAKIDTVSGNVITEASRAESAETALDEKIDVVSGAVDDVQDEVDILSAALEDEVSARTDADSAIQALVDTVSGDVITEVTRATSAETTLDTKIDGKVQEVTQAEYDALVSGGTLDPLVLYVITDAVEVNMNDYYKKTEVESMIDAAVSGKADADSVYTKAEVDEAIDDIDLSNYYTKSETSGATEIQNALDGKANTGDVKTFVAGRGINIATGETADTIAFNLPVYLSGSSAVSVGQPIGKTMYDNKVNGFSATAIGAGLNSLNSYETATGVHNIQRTISNVFGNSGSTLFTIGNGAGDGNNYRHNALEVRQNGDIYIPDTNDTSHSEFYKKPMIKLQDALGQGGISSGEVQTMIDNSISGKTNQSDFETYSGAVESRLAEDEEVTAAGLNALNDRLSEDEEVTAAGLNALNESLSGKQDTLVSGTNIKTINNESLLGSGNIDIQGGGSSYTAGDGIDITNNVISVTGKADTSAVTAIQDSLSGYVTTDTEQIISGRKIFTYSASSSKAIEFKQTDDSAKVGFRVRTSAATNNELASFEFRPNTFTVDGVKHPLLYFGHYRNNNTASGGIEQTVIGFRQYDQLNEAAYHYLIPLPERAKTPFNLTTSFKDYYAPMGFKNGSTMITADDTGVVDLSSEFGGLKLVKLTQAEYDALATKDSSTLYVIVD